eukprot:CAMPEP_0197631380 /NCGR_PEP_ID=MMETSP1338-20131121/8554_1 /TAXON_ID=43686 ORGANISM="Pelagodinium beii, Strain RCC1491" /NCGR_SAMPLE_ID=MMETSP1338 /ASSEMBLY_ACC=CAM_ASM_000754 /LENGTH=161 /DNA_ID=CAMNT_0043202805 /DNA_START=4103 /DNA_END=4590 /DNA_ORIENTATION=+
MARLLSSSRVACSICAAAPVVVAVSVVIVPVTSSSPVLAAPVVVAVSAVMIVPVTSSSPLLVKGKPVDVDESMGAVASGESASPAPLDTDAGKPGCGLHKAEEHLGQSCQQVQGQFPAGQQVTVLGERAVEPYCHTHTPWTPASLRNRRHSQLELSSSEIA